MFRTGTKPSRIAYPCQRAALSQSLVLFAVFPFSFRCIIHFLKYRLNWNAISGLAIALALISAITFSSSVAYDKMLSIRNRIQLKKISAELAGVSVGGMALSSPAQAAVPSPHRVVMVHNSNAASWHNQSIDYWNMISQTAVDDMVYRGLKELTGTSSVSAAWRVLIPNYQPHQKIAIKVNNNNVGFWGDWPTDRDDDIDAIIEPVNAIVKSLQEAFGSDISGADIWVYESYKTFFGASFMDKAIGGIQFYSAQSGGPANTHLTAFSGTAPDSVITFRYNPALSLALNDVVANANYLINIPIVKKHGDGSATLGFKNHYGSIETDYYTSFSTAFHAARFPRTNNDLVDINNNTHIKDKTVLILGDAIIGGRDMNYTPPSLWSTRFASEGTPEMLFFAVDPVAADSVMADLLLWERGSENTANTRNYMLEAMDLGLGVAEVGTWSGASYPNVSATYNNIDFVHVNMDVAGTLSISVTPDAWSMGEVAPGGVRSSAPAEAFTVSNDGTLTGTLSMQITNPGTGWTPGASQGVETYVLRGLFCGDADDPRAYFVSDDVLSATATLSTPSVFGNAALTEDGVSVPPGENVKLWFQFGAPTRTSRATPQNMGVTVAIQPD